MWWVLKVNLVIDLAKPEPSFGQAEQYFYIFFELTVGSRIDYFENILNSFRDDNQRIIMKDKIKDEMSFPDFMQFVNIVCIYKGKGDKMDLQNDRGIFLVNVIKSIFMKMVWSEVYDILDDNMSDSNVGGRKKKTIGSALIACGYLKA